MLTNLLYFSRFLLLVTLYINGCKIRELHFGINFGPTIYLGWHYSEVMVFHQCSGMTTNPRQLINKTAFIFSVWKVNWYVSRSWLKQNKHIRTKRIAPNTWFTFMGGSYFSWHRPTGLGSGLKTTTKHYVIYPEFV